MSHTKEGYTYAVEGGEGTGKGTIVRAIDNRLNSLGISVETVREPGGTELGEIVREYLLHKDDVDWDPVSETLAFNLARRLLFHKIGRLISSGLWVSSDRTYLSTLAYQGYARDQLDMALAITEPTIEGYEPDMLLVVDTDVETALSRQSVKDRIGSEDIEFHKRVAQGYVDEAKNRGLPIIDGNAPLSEVTDEVWSHLEPKTKLYI